MVFGLRHNGCGKSHEKRSKDGKAVHGLPYTIVPGLSLMSCVSKGFSVRITGGKLGGRRLVAPDDGRVRPTSNRTRQAMFNILEHRDFDMGFTLENIAVADLFAGTGALGIEALSRGARICLFVDDDADSRALIRENVESLSLTGVTKIWRRDATDLGPLGAGAGGPFGLVFLDPPYRQNLIPPALKSLRGGGWLTPQALLVAETSKGEKIETLGFTILDTRDYGDTEIAFLTPSE
jgi:16S rRNA (guanine966-N2)-methyltransferase